MKASYNNPPSMTAWGSISLLWSSLMVLSPPPCCQAQFPTTGSPTLSPSPTRSKAPSNVPTISDPPSLVPSNVPTNTPTVSQSPTIDLPPLVPITFGIPGGASGLFLPAVTATQEDWSCLSGPVPLSMYTVTASLDDKIHILTNPPDLVRPEIISGYLTLIWNMEVVQGLGLVDTLGEPMTNATDDPNGDIYTGIEVRFPPDQLLRFESCCGLEAGQIRGRDFGKLAQIYLNSSDVNLDGEFQLPPDSTLDITVFTSTARFQFHDNNPARNLQAKEDADLIVTGSVNSIAVGEFSSTSGSDASRVELDGFVFKSGYVGISSWLVSTTNVSATVDCSLASWANRCQQVGSIDNPVNVKQPLQRTGADCPYRFLIPPYKPWTYSSGFLGQQLSSSGVVMLAAVTVWSVWQQLV
mmetsp:Transcript_10669/g.29402  ORF Transcript_10669/g.29402 Transcript_10669/m.29402 type:complete len:411 (-) Transcript_10669:259-1491(-)|eukprot:CAMPEP_0168742222 /NCGR_PEP_ID=MMETSP0724-20121128/12923_1 /TAXON_ID=265536 /ORGANISM="Amphiprora sp., Strain CCMP467" /LENGTH=410 /DNA_ID=CAMNT_0008789761 /DNA_START=53 /DNA_END=1285 /DNA_ORIENTATION=-